MENHITTSSPSVNKEKLENKVKSMYTDVAENPHGEFHFEMGINLALRLGYQENELNQVPSDSVDSFAGVGYHFRIANIKPGEKILDLGSGSGMDVFIAANKTGNSGKVAGMDMTDAQLDKASRLADANGFNNVVFQKGYIEGFDFEHNSIDVIISNGVINLSAEKDKVFRQISSILVKGGRMAISDIVTEQQMPDTITCNSTLWAACIGGAMQQDNYQKAIEKVGMKVVEMIENKQYSFASTSAVGASKQYGVKSISLLAVKL